MIETLAKTARGSRKESADRLRSVASTSLTVAVLLASGLFCLPTEAQDASSVAFKTIRGKHLVLKADGGSAESLRELVDAFDAAVPQWAAFWGLAPGALDQWSVDAFVMNDKQAFRDQGDLPAHMNFPFGYAISGNVWAMRQQSQYYTRHLLLHEGAHALAIELFDGTGPSWFAEGLAEMLSVHSGQGANVKINVVPVAKESVPYWGRFKLLSQRRAAKRIPSIDAVLGYPLDLNSDVESYGWSWVAMMLFTQYPEYRQTVLTNAKRGSDRSKRFTAKFQRDIASQMPLIRARWRLLCETIDYGFDWSNEKVDLSMKDKLWDGSTLQFKVDARRGWQSPGVRFPPGTTIRILAGGSCVLDNDPKPWISKPPGVTVEYAGGAPLGQLTVAVVPNRSDERRTLDPMRKIAVESRADVVLKQHSWLLFRINDHLGKRGDNVGEYSVRIQANAE